LRRAEVERVSIDLVMLFSLVGWLPLYYIR
jgi:hypothetical protein